MSRRALHAGRRILPLALAAAALVAGCAPYPAAPPVPRVTPPAPGATQRAGSPAATVPAPAAARIDTVPSREAAEVLARIPEPLRPEERVPPEEIPAAAGGATPVPGGEAPVPADSAAPVAPADSGAVPVPAPTFPLGLEPPPPPDTTAVAPADSTAPPPAASPSAPPRSATPPAAAAPPPRTAPPAAPADTCWRVQVAAPDEAGKAGRLRDAAESQLLVPMVIEHERGLHKVRTRDCMGAAAADALRRRADASGFGGAFRFVGTRR